MLAIDNLSVKYDNNSNFSLRNVNFSVKKGELVVIAGESGSGKSTLAQAILGLIPNFVNAEVTGQIHYNNQVLSNISRRKLIQTFGYVPQYPSDFTTSLLVEEEMAFPLENLRIESDEIKARIEDILQELEILNLKGRLITELSSGELQRVALATTLTLDPPILILDEPMARMDPKTEIRLASLLRKLADQSKMILAFEHHLDYLLPKADRVILLSEGQVTAKGKPKSILKALKDVDLPEISHLRIPQVNSAILSLDEAEQQVVEWFTK